MQTNRLAALVLAGVLCLGTAACGSSDSDGAASTTEPTEASTTTAADDAGDGEDPGDSGDSGDSKPSPEKAAFIEAADKICKESTDAINEQTADMESEDLDEDAFDEFLQMAATESAKQIAAVRALGFPEADREELDAAFVVFEEAFAKVVEDPANTLEHTSTPEFEEASTFLTDYGFQECGGSGE